MNKVRKFDLKALAASAVLFAILQGLMSAEVIGPFWELNLILICMNVILASSLNMINGFTGQFSIGHAGFLAVGAYMGAVMTVKLGFSFPLAIVAAFWVSSSVCLPCGWTATIWPSRPWV